jgi:serine/threonine protein kinase
MPFGKNSLPEINEADLGKVKDVGHGSYGSVITGSFKRGSVPQGAKSGVIYAHKQMGKGYNLHNRNIDVPIKSVTPEIMEMAVMFDSNHKNVMRGVSAYLLKEDVPGKEVDVVNLTIAMELALGVLELNKKAHRTWDMVSQIMLGLNHLHINGIAHYDLKPKNILVFKDTSAGGRLVPKITDFGLSIAYMNSESTFEGRMYRGTKGWLPYEMNGNDPKSKLSTIEVGRKSDLFSLGVIIVNLLGKGSRQDVEKAVYNEDRDQAKKEVSDIIKRGKVYSDSISTKIANFVFDNFLGVSIQDRTELRECLQSNEFEELCALTKSNIVFPLDEETHFTCLIPYEGHHPNNFRNDVIKRISGVGYVKYSTLTKIYAIDLYDRVVKSGTITFDGLPMHLKYMKTCLTMCNSMFEIVKNSNAKINVEIYLNIINAVNGTLYRALSTFLTKSNDWEYILHLLEALKENPLDDIVNKGCSDYNPEGMSVVHSAGLLNVKPINETTVSFMFNKGSVPYGAKSGKKYWQTVGGECISSGGVYSPVYVDENAKALSIMLNSNHNNIIKAVSTYFMNNDVDEMCPTAAIEAPLGFLNKNNKKYQTWDICAQIMLGANYLNENGILHTDLTCNSVVVYQINKRYVPRITNLDKTKFLNRFRNPNCDAADAEDLLTFNNTEDCGHIILNLLGKNYDPSKLTNNTYDEGYTHKYIAKVMLANGCVYAADVMYKISKFLVKYLLNPDYTQPKEPLYDVINTPAFKKLIQLTKANVSVEDTAASSTKNNSFVKSKIPSLMNKRYIYPHPSKFSEYNVSKGTLVYAIDLYNRCLYLNHYDYITFGDGNELFDNCVTVITLLFGDTYSNSMPTIAKDRFNKIVANVDGLLFREIPSAEIVRIKKLIEN